MAARKEKNSVRTQPTIKDVASRAGVSRTAVSYVLNDPEHRNTHVSDEARAKVLQAIQELHFRPDARARALSRGHSDEIALLIDTILSPFTSEFVTSIQRQALYYGYTPIIYLSQGLSDTQRKDLLQTMLARHPIGIITGHFNFTADDVALAHKMGTKYIIFTSFHPMPFEQTYSIVFPSWDLGYLAATHLITRGHRHLALVHPANEMQEEAFAQRLAGMRAAMAEQAEATIDLNLDILPLRLSSADACALVESYLLHSDRPTGIYAFSDEYALTLLGALTRLGIQVPQEVALVGTDNLPIGELTWPSLTSISFDALDMGKRAIDLLHALYHDLPLSTELTRPLIPQLIPREST